MGLRRILPELLQATEQFNEAEPLLRQVRLWWCVCVCVSARAPRVIFVLFISAYGAPTPPHQPPSACCCAAVLSVHLQTAWYFGSVWILGSDVRDLHSSPF